MSREPVLLAFAALFLVILIGATLAGLSVEQLVGLVAVVGTLCAVAARQKVTPV